MNRDRSKKAELMERNSALIGKKFRKTYLPASFCSLSRIAVIAIDSIVAGSSIGATALAAVALFSPISSMDEVIFDLCGSGMTNNIAKLRGEHEQDKANQFFTFTLLRMICIYLVFCTLLIVFARPVLYRWKAVARVLHEGNHYVLYSTQNIQVYSNAYF